MSQIITVADHGAPLFKKDGGLVCRLSLSLTLPTCFLFVSAIPHKSQGQPEGEVVEFQNPRNKPSNIPKIILKLV